MSKKIHKRKLLFVIDSLQGGGAERVLTILLRLLPSQQYHITVVSVYAGGRYEEDVKTMVNRYVTLLPDVSKDKGLKKFIRRRKKSLLTKWLPLKWVWRKYVPVDADVEIAFLEGFSSRFVAASPNHKSMKYAWVHVDLEKLHWITPWYRGYDDERKSFASYHKVIGVSDEVSAAARNLYQLDNVITLYNPVDYQDIRKQASEHTSYPARREGVLRIVSVGRYTAQKGYNTLLQAFKILIERGGKAELLLIGEGHERSQYEAFIRKHELQNSVILTGFMKNPYPCLKSADVFICSSETEGYSTAITEALVLGVPVVSTEVPGIHRQLQNEHFGVLCERSAEGMAASLEMLLNHPAMLEHLRNNTKTYVEDMEMDSYISKIDTLFSAHLPTK